MDAEPLPPLDLPTPSDAEMRIDYGDEEPVVDVPMVDEVAEEAPLEEAVMGDAEPGDALVQEEDAVVMEEIEAPVVPELAQPTDEEEKTTALETSAGDGPIVTESALVEEQQETVTDESKTVEQEVQQESTIVDESAASSLVSTTLADTEPAAALSSTLLPAASDEIAPVIEDSGSAAEISLNGAAPPHPSTEEQEQLGEIAAVEETTMTAEEGEQPADEAHEVVVVGETFGEDGEVIKSVETTQWTEAEGEVEGAVEELEEHAKISEAISEEADSTLPTNRPSLNKSLLSVIELPPSFALDSADVDVSSSLTAPTVLLSFQNETYSVFRRHESTDDTEDGLDHSLPVLFEQADKHELYYEQVERFIESLHGLFPELASGEEELVLELPEIGIALPEDNVYTRQVCLEDLDRVHVGCGLAGRLHLQLSAQPRFASGFNALVDHIANSHGKAVNSEAADVVARDETAPVDEETIAPPNNDTEESYVNVEQLSQDDMVEPPGVDDENGTEGGEEHFEDGEWHDEDVVYEGEAGEYEEHEDGEHEHDFAGSGEEVDFEEALADMDSDDLNAVIEGAQEDYVLAEGAVEGTDEEAGVEAEVREEQDEGGDFSVEGAEGEATLADGLSEVVDAASGGEGTPVVVVEEQSTIVAVETPTREPLAEDAGSLAVLDAATGDPPAPPVFDISPIVEISYDTPLGTGDEAPAVPLEQLDAVVDAASKLGPSPLNVSNGVAVDEAVSVLDEPEEPSNDVVIDYEDAEEVTISTPLPPPSAKDSPLSPKRGREDPDDEVPAIDEESAAGDAKRPRLSDLEPETTSITASTA